MDMGEPETMEARVAEANRTLESTAQGAVNWGVEHECQIRDFEAELASALSNSRAVHNLLIEALNSIEANRQRVDQSLHTHIPHLTTSLSSSTHALSSLSTLLPTLSTQIHTISRAYASGRLKAHNLTSDLEWKRTPLVERLVRIALFRPKETTTPVRRRDVVLVRVGVVLCLIVLMWQLGGAVEGAYRAYRHRLVWGDKLIS